MPFHRRTSQPVMPKTQQKLERLPSPDLETLLETSLSRTAELFRGLSHKELDTKWVLLEMEMNLNQAMAVTQALLRRVED